MIKNNYILIVAEQEFDHRDRKKDEYNLCFEDFVNKQIEDIKSILEWESYCIVKSINSHIDQDNYILLIINIEYDENKRD